jgi:hypothetical protein
MKALYDEHTVQAPPRRVGAAVGAIVGGHIWSAVSEKPIVAHAQGMAEDVNRPPGAVSGGVLGRMPAQAYRNLKRVRDELPKIPIPWRYRFAPISRLIMRVGHIRWERIAQWLLGKSRTDVGQDGGVGVCRRSISEQSVISTTVCGNDL